MQEFWFCSACKSMNRATTARCYRCGAVREQATLATVAERPRGVVLTPGLDEEHREVAWMLMSANRYFSAWRLGYVAATLLVLFPVLFLLTWVLDTSIVVGAGSVYEHPDAPAGAQVAFVQGNGALWQDITFAVSSILMR